MTFWETGLQTQTRILSGIREGISGLQRNSGTPLHEPQSKLLKRGVIEGVIYGATIGVIKGDTQSLDSNSHENLLVGLLLVLGSKITYYFQGCLGFCTRVILSIKSILWSSD